MSSIAGVHGDAGDPGTLAARSAVKVEVDGGPLLTGAVTDIAPHYSELAASRGVQVSKAGPSEGPEPIEQAEKAGRRLHVARREEPVTEWDGRAWQARTMVREALEVVDATSPQGRAATRAELHRSGIDHKSDLDAVMSRALAAHR